MIGKLNPAFKNLTILVISPQPWGEMFISKQHYASELASMGNRVYFLNPPLRAGIFDRFNVSEVKKNLHVIDHNLIFPMFIRFHIRSMYNFFMGCHVRSLIGKLDLDFDLTWCFDSNLYSDLDWFRSNMSIYHPVDQITGKHQNRLVSSANLVLTVSDSIGKNIELFKKRAKFINHGLSETFAQVAKARLEKDLDNISSAPLNAGYVGNLLINSLDRCMFRQIVEKNKNIKFHLWGSYEKGQTNLSGSEDAGVHKFINFLKSSPNVVLNGVVPQTTLAEEILDMNIFFLCYDIKKDPNEGSNSHKIIEYLSTGKVIVSNYVSCHKNTSMLVMPGVTKSEELADLFRDVTENIIFYNHPNKQRKRIEFALQNTYRIHIEYIFKMLNGISII